MTGRLVVLLLALLLGRVHAIYPDGHFDHVNKIESPDQLDALVTSTLEAGQTLMVRWIASAN